jgi:hypothetical protein
MNINYDAQRKSYQFKDSFHEIYIPALDDGQVDNYIHEIDFFNEIRMDLGLSYKTESKHTEIYNLFFRFIDNKLPFDILIRENKIIGFYQNGQIFKTFNVEKNKTISCNDADVILRVHNFMFFNKQHIPAYNFNVIKNGDGQYWFLIKGMLKISGEYLINIYENIELIR